METSRLVAAVSILPGRSSLRRRRDAKRLIFEILSLARSGATKTQLVYLANLNFRLAESYLRFLTSKGLINKKENDDGGMIFGLTAKGEHLLGSLVQVEKELVGLCPKAHQASSPLAQGVSPIELRDENRNKRATKVARIMILVVLTLPVVPLMLATSYSLDFAAGSSNYSASRDLDLNQDGVVDVRDVLWLLFFYRPMSDVRGCKPTVELRYGSGQNSMITDPTFRLRSELECSANLGGAGL